MSLSFPFFKTKKEKAKYYLALILTQEKAGVVILEEIHEKLKIISRQNQLFKSNIEELEDPDLIEAIDHAISRAIEALPPEVEIQKTVFGVKESWIDKETAKIKKNYLQKLKKVCDSLDLSPIGFIITGEAISNLIQDEEGAPLSAIFAELGRKNVALTLYRGGKTIQTVEGALKGNYAPTVDELLKQFTIEVLPARIILYDTELDNGLIQQFIKHTWSKSLPFLHMPQISVLPPDFDGRAITAGAATQMGLEPLSGVGHEIKTYEYSADDKNEPEPVKEEEAIKENITEDIILPAASGIVIPEENFGFVEGKDIEEFHQQQKHEKDDDDPEEYDDSKPLSSPGVHFEDEDPRDDEEDAEEEKYTLNENENSDTGKKKSSPFKLPGFSLPSGSLLWVKIVVVPLIIIGFVAGAAVYLYFNKVSASVLVTLTPKDVAQSEDVVFTSGASNDFSNNIIAAKQIDGNLDGSMTTAATGKKDVGDKAHGSVTVYNNNTESDITLSAGTEIKSSNGLVFTLDKEVNVSSASGDIFSGTKPGTASVDVTAGDIGTGYNMPSDTKFSVDGNNSMAAKNDNAFSGGTKKTITIVSKDDLAKLKKDLLKNLEDKAGQELIKQTESNSSILPVVLSTSIEKTKYDKNAGDEAKTVKLSATINFTGLSFRESDQKDYVRTVLAKKYSDNMTFDENNVDVKVKDPQKESDKEISGTLTINASLLPKISTGDLAKKLSGKAMNDMNKIISGLPQVQSTSVSYRPNISFLAKLFPRLPNNVTVTLSSN